MAITIEVAIGDFNQVTCTSDLAELLERLVVWTTLFVRRRRARSLRLTSLILLLVAGIAMIFVTCPNSIPGAEANVTP